MVNGTLWRRPLTSLTHAGESNLFNIWEKPPKVIVFAMGFGDVFQMSQGLLQTKNGMPGMDACFPYFRKIAMMLGNIAEKEDQRYLAIIFLTMDCTALPPLNEQGKQVYNNYLLKQLKKDWANPEKMNMTKDVLDRLGKVIVIDSNEHIDPIEGMYMFREEAIQHPRTRKMGLPSVHSSGWP